jgi:hypothetical protein
VLGCHEHTEVICALIVVVVVVVVVETSCIMPFLSQSRSAEDATS